MESERKLPKRSRRTAELIPEKSPLILPGADHPHEDEPKLEHRLFPHDQLLLLVEHERGWLTNNRDAIPVGTFLSQIRDLQNGDNPVFPSEIASQHPPFRFQQESTEFPEITVFSVKWHDNKSVAQQLRDFETFLANHPDEKGVLLSDNQGKKAYLKRAIPNWYMGAVGHSGIGTHGPFSRPRKVTAEARKKRLTFELPDTPTTPASGDMDIFVLDTLPAITHMSDWRKRIASAPDEPPFKGDTALLAPFGQIPVQENGKVRYDDGNITYIYAPLTAFADTGFVTLVDGQPCYDELTLRNTSEDMHTAETHGRHVHIDKCEQDEDHPQDDVSDHGLFVAGIIHDLVPSARIYVIEVLNRFGIGTFATLAEGFRIVEGLRTPGRKAIVNCSFVLSFPTHEQKQFLAQPEGEAAKLFKGLLAFNEVALGVEKVVDDSVVLLQSIADSVAAKEGGGEAVIVAAVGNDSYGKATREDTRYPAALTRVFKYSRFVAAVGALQTPGPGNNVTSYSNITPANGLRAYGGEYPSASNVGVISTFSAPTFDDGTKNTAGFAEWSGTSFATPVVVSKIAETCLKSGVNPIDGFAVLRGTSGGPRKVTVYEKPR
jgi:hypothetical protein